MDAPIDADAIRDAVAHRRFSAVEVCRAPLGSHRGAGPATERLPRGGRASARSRAPPSSTRARTRAALPLLGVPIALKDNICTRGIATTASSRILEGYMPPYDATVVERLEAAGAVDRRQDQLRRVRDGLLDRELCVRPDPQPVGARSDTPEDRAADRPPRWRRASCRWRSDRIPADRSASPRRSAASWASSRHYGRVSRYGLLAFASSLDQIGPLARSVKDAALVMRRDCRTRSTRFDFVADAPVPDFSSARSTTRATLGAACGSACRVIFSAKGWTREVMAAFDAAIEVTRSAGSRDRGRHARAQPRGHSGVLRDRHGGGQREPGAVRRRALRVPRERRADARRDVRSHPRTEASAEK